jgi:hypothetical protein
MSSGLRPMREADLDMVRRWRNAPDVRKNMYTTHEISPEEHRAWWERISADPASRQLFNVIDG